MRKFLILFFLLYGAMMASAQKTNPRTNIDWPTGCSVFDAFSGSCLGVQGTDTNLMSSGLISGSDSPLCTDSVLGATTNGCPAQTLGYTIVPPISGQFIFIAAGTKTDLPGGLGPGCGGGVPTGSLLTTLSSAYITSTPCGNGFTSNHWGTTWSNFSLPAGITAGQVTAIYGFSENSQTWSTGSTFGGVSCASAPDSGGVGLSATQHPMQQFTGLLTSTLGADIPGITCQANLNYSTSPPYTVELNTPVTGILVYYTGTPVYSPVTTPIQPPLLYDPVTGLSIDPTTPFPGEWSIVYTVATLPSSSVAAPYVVMPISDANPDCTHGGGTGSIAQIWCQAVNGIWSQFAAPTGTYTGNILNIQTYPNFWENSGANAVIGGLGQGAGGTDLTLDTLTNTYGSWKSTMVRVNGSLYNVPLVLTVNGTQDIGQGGYFRMGATGGVFIFTLSGNATTYFPTYDNPGHIVTFDIVQAASGGPYTWTWPSGFINAPVISTMAGASTVAQFLYDGTNYIYIP
jgi:hypothetical protein